MYTPLEVIELSKFYNKAEAVKNISLWKNYYYRNDIRIIKAYKRKGVNKRI